MLTPVQVVGNLRLIKNGELGGSWSRSANTFKRDITTNSRYQTILFDLLDQVSAWNRQGSAVLNAAMPALYEKLVDAKVFSANGKFLAKPLLDSLLQVSSDAKLLNELRISRGAAAAKSR